MAVRSSTEAFGVNSSPPGKRAKLSDREDDEVAALTDGALPSLAHCDPDRASCPVERCISRAGTQEDRPSSAPAFPPDKKV